MPAETFEAYRVEGNGGCRSPKGVVRLQGVYWIAPKIKRVLASGTMCIHTAGMVRNNERLDLTAYSQFQFRFTIDAGAVAGGRAFAGRQTSSFPCRPPRWRFSRP